jgi:hypothetical protein
MQAGDLIGAQEVDIRLSDLAKWEFGASARCGAGNGTAKGGSKVALSMQDNIFLDSAGSADDSRLGRLS